MAKYTNLKNSRSGRRQRGSTTASSISSKNPASRLRPASATNSTEPRCPFPTTSPRDSSA